MSRRQMSHVERSHIMNHKPCCLLSRQRAEKDNKDNDNKDNDNKDNDNRDLCPAEKDHNSKRFRPRGSVWASLKYLQPWKLIIFWEPNNWGQEVILRNKTTLFPRLYTWTIWISLDDKLIAIMNTTLLLLADFPLLKIRKDHKFTSSQHQCSPSPDCIIQRAFLVKT